MFKVGDKVVPCLEPPPLNLVRVNASMNEENQKFLHRQLKHLGLRYFTIKKVDGDHISFKEIDEIYRAVRFKKYVPVSISYCKPD